MLTPAFELSQDEKFIYVYIKTPYIKISDVEYFIEDRCFKFYVKPYFLSLNFPGKIVENGDESASYDVDKGLFTVRLPKLIVGEDFPDLDLVTKLLAPSGKCNVASPGIEVISQETARDGNDDDNEDENDFDWEYSQEIYDEEREKQLGVVGCKYGFANQKSGVFYRLKDELKDVVENPNPDELSYSERRLARMAAEDRKFDEEHYLADFFEDKRIKEILAYVIENKDAFNEIEKEKHRQLPNREYILNHKEEISVCYSLVDIIFAFAYNKRTTFGESTVESAWTISKMSSTLSWFERFTSLDEVLNACVRRALSYPLYRHWELSCKVLQDVKDIFRIGRRKILKCLLEILMLFNASEPRYLLNELYITDYCIWIQKVKETKIESLAKKLLEANISKGLIGWDLKELETAAMLVYDEERSSASDYKSSSSEDSTNDDNDEVESYDSSDSDCTGPETTCQISSTCSKKASFCEGKMENGEENAMCVQLDVQNKKPVNLIIEKSETDSENETDRKIKVLPSLLSPKQGFCGKKLVEVLNGEENADNMCSAKSENANIDESVCCEDVDVDKRDQPNRSVHGDEKEFVFVEQADTEQELSCKISELVLNE